MTKWQVVSLILNSVHYSRNFIFCGFFFLPSIVLYSDQIFYQEFLDLYGFLSKMEYIY